MLIFINISSQRRTNVGYFWRSPLFSEKKKKKNPWALFVLHNKPRTKCTYFQDKYTIHLAVPKDLYQNRLCLFSFRYLP